MTIKPLAKAIALGLLSVPLAQAQTAAENPQQPAASGAQTTQAGGIDPRRERLQLGGDSAVTSGNRFNPAISVILDGVYGNFSREVESPPGFDDGHNHGHSHGHDHSHGVEEGFQLREAEIAISGPVDPYFDMMVQLGVTESDIEIEEAYITTRALPAGFQIKAGKFLSDVGYINRQHIHDWDFVDQPWLREFMFGDEGLGDTGLQFSWLAPTLNYTRVGFEVLEGNNPGVANNIGEERVSLTSVEVDTDDSANRIRFRDYNGLEDKTGPRLFTIFGNYAPDIGYEHAIQFGASAGHATSFQDQEFHSSGRLETWDGDTWFAGLDVVYKYNGAGVMGHGNITLQGEYLLRTKELNYVEREFDSTSSFGAPSVDRDLRFKQDALYVQGVYGFAPRWNTGLRLDAIGMTNQTFDGGGPDDASTSFRYTGQVSYAPTEFSRIRAQIAYNDLHEAHDHDGHGHNAWQLMLQYNISLGEHGAHSF